MGKKKNIKDKLDQFTNETFQQAKLEDIIGDRFGRYSKSIIQERAIPDVRDGLKPVQRRILFGMSQLKLISTAPYKKCAKVVGDVMGKYHPHGDSSIYEALIRMSQTWKMRVPLIDLQGNNGSIDGDGPAAYRYTECRMSSNADYLLQDIEKNTVEMIDNFDGEEKEPTVLPARFPNLLVNGGMGISSGYATYIPTHNLKEVIDATIYKIDHRNMNVDDLLKIMPGPDFPTGGIAMGKKGIREAFLTGSGTVVVRSKYSIEKIDDSQERIVVTEIPYDTVKQKTVEKIEQIRIDQKVDGIEEVRDETDRKGLRIAIDLKNGANSNAIIDYLFKNTNLQVNVKYNMVAISNMTPKKMGVLEILDSYIEHQKDVITNRTNYLRSKDQHRLHIVEGLIKMVSILDKVIKTIRKSENKADAKIQLIEKFNFSEIQADAILVMQLYRLSNTDIVQLKNEFNTLTENIKGYDEILSSEKNLLKVIKNELKIIESKVESPRLTQIEDEVANININEADLILKENYYVIATRTGYLKKVSPKSYKISSVNTTDEKDVIIFEKEISSLDTLLGFTNLGNFVYIPVFKIDECKTRDQGTFVNNICQINPSEHFISFYDISDFTLDYQLLFATKTGLIKQVLLSEFSISRYTKEVKCIKLNKDDELVSVDITNMPREIIIGASNCEVLRIRANDISLYSKNAAGVKAIKLKDDSYLVGSCYSNIKNDILLLTNRGYIKRCKVSELTLSKRGRSGIRMIRKVKSSPFILKDIKQMTPNQYKENALINVIYDSSSDLIESNSLKYNLSDAGKQILKDGLGEPLKMNVAESKSMEEFVDDSYLIDKSANVDLLNFDTIDEKPLKSNKKDNIDELDKILEMESKKEEYETKDSNIVKTKSSTIVKKKKISKINFFEDDKDKDR